MLEEIKKNGKGIVLMFVSATSLCIGQLIWKKMDGVQILPLLLGFIVYGIGALVMIVAFRYGELSVLQPMNSMSYVISTILGYFVLRENVTIQRLVGIVIIVIGVFILASAGNSTNSNNLADGAMHQAASSTGTAGNSGNNDKFSNVESHEKSKTEGGAS